MEGAFLVMRRAWLGVLGVLLVPAGLAAQAGRAAVEEANRLYGEGRFAEAHERYLDALREAPESPVIRFNDGSALYQNAEFEQALQAYGDAVESGDPALVSDAWYNIGNVLYRQQMLQESLEAFKQSLRLDPSDEDAKHNLERVLEQMQQQKQDQDDQNQDQQQDRDDDQQNQDQQEQNDDEQQNEDEQEDQDQQQDDENEDQQNQDEEQQDADQNDQDQDQQDDQQQGQPPPAQQPQMTPEEAERLLDAIEEDQDEVNRQPRAAARGRRPRKDW